MTHPLKVSPRRDDPGYPDAAQTPGLQRPDPPAALLNAVKLMYVGAVASVIHAVAYVATQGAEKTAIARRYPHLSAGAVSTVTHVAVIGGGIGSLLGAALFIWIARSCLRGQSRARITGTLFFAVGVLAAVYDLVSPRTAAVTIVALAVLPIGLAAVALLWQRSSSAYFTLFERPRL